VHGGVRPTRGTSDADDGGAARSGCGRGVGGVGRRGHRRIPSAGDRRGVGGDDGNRAPGYFGHCGAAHPLDDATIRAGGCRGGGDGRSDD